MKRSSPPSRGESEKWDMDRITLTPGEDTFDLGSVSHRPSDIFMADARPDGGADIYRIGRAFIDRYPTLRGLIVRLAKESPGSVYSDDPESLARLLETDAE